MRRARHCERSALRFVNRALRFVNKALRFVNRMLRFANKALRFVNRMLRFANKAREYGSCWNARARHFEIRLDLKLSGDLNVE